MKRQPSPERPLTAAPHDHPRHIDEEDIDENDTVDLDRLPLDEALRRMAWR